MELFWYDIREIDDETYRIALSQMSPQRKKRVSQIAAEDDRKRTVAAELLTRREVGKKLGVAPEKVVLAIDENEKPYIEGNPLYISVSHSGNWAVCAIADKPIGVDVEEIRGVQEKFVVRTCSEGERAYIRYGDAGYLSRFWECWTAKEALFKLTGKGPLLALSRQNVPENVILELMLQKGCAVTAAMEQ